MNHNTITMPNPFGDFERVRNGKLFKPHKTWRDRLRDIFKPFAMAISQAMTDSFKKELLQAKHNFSVTGGNNFKIALYTSAATMNNGTTAYSASNEANGTNYTAGGTALGRNDPTNTGNVAFTDFNDVVWQVATITARGALVYNADQANAAVAVLDFGSDKTSTAGNFTIIFPAADSSNAILRVGP